MRLYTARYSARGLDASGLVAVRTSLGAPRFKLPYKIAATLPEAMPERWMLRITDEEAYRQHYLALLERVGWERMRDRLEGISRQHGGRDLALLCFEDLTEPGQWCHRRMLAAWIEAHAGEPVEEWEPKGEVEGWTQGGLL